MVIKKRCTFANRNEQRSLGSLAQLVQSVCLTSRGSGVRLPQLPQKEVSNQADLFRYILPRLLFGSSEMRILSIERTQEGDDGIHLRTAQLFP